MNLHTIPSVIRAAAPELNDGCVSIQIRGYSHGRECAGERPSGAFGRLTRLFLLRGYLGVVLLVTALATAAQAQSSVTLAWDPSPDSAIGGYRLYEGAASRTYTNVIDVGNVTTATVTGLVDGVTYFFAVTAYDTNGLESDFSGEISYTVPLPTNTPPTIKLTSPGDGNGYPAPATISLGASVTANGHTISQVQFYNGATLLGAVAAAPYSFSWNNVSAGTYSLSATVLYDSGGTVASAAAIVTVAAVRPPSGLTFAADSGTISAPFAATNGTVFQDVETNVTSGGLAVYGFDVVNGGNYLVSALVNAPTETINSFYVNIDAEPTDPVMIWDIPVGPGLVSRTVSWRGNGTEDPASAQYSPKVFTLSAGTHQLIIRGREANTTLGTISIQAAPPTLQMVLGLAVSVGGQSSVTMAWDASPDSSIAGYRLYEGVASQTYTNVIDVGNVTAVTATGLAGGATYFYAVTAYDTNGAESAFSGEISYTVPLPTNPPPAITLAVLGGSVFLSGAGQPGQTYNVLASQDLNIWTVIGTVTADASGSFTFTDPAGTSSPIRMYRLQSTAVTPPALQIQAAAGDSGSVTLTWDPTLDIDVAGYRLYEGGASQTYTNAFDVGNVTTVTATGLVGGATYFYTVTAYDYSGVESDFYAETSYTAPLPTLMPPAVTLSAQGQSSVTLTWEPSPDSAVAGYRLHEGGANQTYTNVIDVGNVTAVTATGLAGGAAYFYAVTAYDSNGAESAFSREISYTVPLSANPPPTITLTALGGSVLLSGSGQAGQTYNVLASQDLNIWTVIGTATTDASGSFTFTDPAGTSSPIRMYRLQCAAVTPPALQIQAAAGDPGNVTLTWDPTVDIDVAGYRLYEGGASQTYTNAFDVGIVTAVTATGLAGGATYFYTVTAYDYNGVESDFYSEISYTVPLPANPPPTITLTALGGSVLLSGAGQAGQTYSVLASQDFNVWTVIGTVTADASGSFTFTDPAGTSLPNCMYRLQAK